MFQACDRPLEESCNTSLPQFHFTVDASNESDERGPRGRLYGKIKSELLQHLLHLVGFRMFCTEVDQRATLSGAKCRMGRLSPVDKKGNDAIGHDRERIREAPSEGNAIWALT